MLHVDELLDQIIYDEGIAVERMNLQGFKGMYADYECLDRPIISLSYSLETTTQENCVKAHELGHHFTTSAALLSASKAIRSREEARARRWEIEYLMSAERLIELWERGHKTPFEMIDFLEITPEEFVKGIGLYYSIHGPCSIHGQYVINWSHFEIKKDRRRKKA